MDDSLVVMKMSCAELLNIDALCIWKMKSQADQTRNLIHNGVKKA
jgi:hypothetical protein